MTNKVKKNVTAETLDQAVDAILDGVGCMFSERDKRFDKIDKHLGKVEENTDRMNASLSHMRDELKGIKEELSLTPSRRDIGDLKSKLEEHIRLAHRTIS